MEKGFSVRHTGMAGDGDHGRLRIEVVWSLVDRLTICCSVARSSVCGKRGWSEGPHDNKKRAEWAVGVELRVRGVRVKVFSRARWLLNIE